VYRTVIFFMCIYEEQFPYRTAFSYGARADGGHEANSSQVLLPPSNESPSLTNLIRTQSSSFKLNQWPSADGS